MANKMNMSVRRALVEFIYGVLGKERYYNRYAKVDALGTGYVDVTLCDSDGKITKVQTIARVDKTADGIRYYPKVGSVVAISYTDRNHAYVSMYSEIDKIEYMGTQYGGFATVNTLTTKLNNIENKVNALVTWSSTHTHTGVTTGGGSSGTAVGVIGTLTPTQQSDIENPNLKHG